MITNYNDPRVTLNQVYKASVVGTTATLGACVIGPHYIIHNYNTDAALCSLLSESLVYIPEDGISSRAYPGKVNKYQGKIALDSVSVFVKNASLLFAEFTSDSASVTVSDNDTLYITEDGSSVVFTGTGCTLDTPAKLGDNVSIVIGSVTYNSYIIGFQKSSAGYYTGCIIEKALPAGKVSSVSIQRVVDGYIKKLNIIKTETTVGVSANAVIKAQLNSDSSVTALYKVISGEFYCEYKAFSEQFTKTYGIAAGTSAVEDIFGLPTKLNPLGLAVHACANAAGSNFVYFVAANILDSAEISDIVQTYLNAVSIISNTDGIYGIVPCTAKAEVLQALLSYVYTQSQLAIPYFKYLYGSALFNQQVTVVLDALVASASGSTDTTITFTKSVLVPVLTTVKGDYLKIGLNLYLIKDTNNKNNVTILGVVTVAASTLVDIIHKITDNLELVNQVVLDKAVADKRACLVIADTPVYLGIKVYNYVVAAAVAGLRSNSYAHAPLSNVVVPGILIGGLLGITNAQSLILGSNGFWRVGEDLEGNVITKRQLTSAATGDVNYDLQSIVCIVDYVCLVLKFAGRSYVGCTNISDLLISLLLILLLVRMNSFTENVSDLLGPMLTQCSLIKLEQDLVDKSKIRALISGTPPYPFNEFNITFYMN